MKLSTLISATTLTLISALAQADATWSERRVSETFAFDAICEGGTSHLYLEHIQGDSYVEIGTVDRDQIAQADGAALLGEEALLAVGESFMSNSALRRSIESCGGGVQPVVDSLATGADDTSEGQPGAHVCYPVSNCGIFDWFCGFIGGSLFKYDESPVAGPHHVCVMPKPKK